MSYQQLKLILVKEFLLDERKGQESYPCAVDFLLTIVDETRSKQKIKFKLVLKRRMTFQTPSDASTFYINKNQSNNTTLFNKINLASQLYIHINSFTFASMNIKNKSMKNIRPGSDNEFLTTFTRCDLKTLCLKILSTIRISGVDLD